MEDKKQIKVFVKCLEKNQTTMFKMNFDDIADKLYLQCFEQFQMEINAPLRLICKGKILDPHKSLEQNEVYDNSLCYLHSPDIQRTLSIDEDAINALMDDVARDFGLRNNPRIILYVNNPNTGEMVRVVRTPTVVINTQNESSINTTNSQQSQTNNETNNVTRTQETEEQPTFNQIIEQSLLNLLQNINNQNFQVVRANQPEQNPLENQQNSTENQQTVGSQVINTTNNNSQIRQNNDQNGLREEQQRREINQPHINPIPPSSHNNTISNSNSTLLNQLRSFDNQFITRPIPTISFQILDMRPRPIPIDNLHTFRGSTRTVLHSVGQERTCQQENSSTTPIQPNNSHTEEKINRLLFELFVTLIFNEREEDVAKEVIQSLSTISNNKEEIIGTFINGTATLLTSLLSESTNEIKHSLLRDVLNIIYYNLYEFYSNDPLTPQQLLYYFKKDIYDIIELNKKYSINSILDLFHRLLHHIVSHASLPPKVNSMISPSIETEEQFLKAVQRCHEVFKL
ncbi:hypothetical protein EDI_135480 [Entamoeba dispar SAW760]|uniref:Ubiquitin-like domain-containing protein n=1 Tax=Entamoeba dispar (strain ATCC PRA-260 / SAW760) TaxID=370354 RepID=B0EEI0_ENTDS|nr:uncharacterized protein EDI_135480 [Entamoeba dispar SAW760]EDR27094.1 hypothetical protein EDI_135480 [Entamoeba dispar SAW760]|eukprot:EDR27094.1 hypothetical protein EDI_135480 [Entamoeba dispar SAW760]